MRDIKNVTRLVRIVQVAVALVLAWMMIRAMRMLYVALKMEGLL